MTWRNQHLKQNRLLSTHQPIKKANQRIAHTPVDWMMLAIMCMKG